MSSPDRPSPRVAPREDAVLVAQHDRQAVDLRLVDVAELRVADVEPLRWLASASSQARSSSSLKALASQSIGTACSTCAKRLERRGADALGRRIGVSSSGCSASIAQLVDQRVVLGVGDLGLVEDVVEVVVTLERTPQLRRAVSRIPLPRADGLRSDALPSDEEPEPSLPHAIPVTPEADAPPPHPREAWGEEARCFMCGLARQLSAR